MSRRYGLIRPCPNCPFRNDIEPYLRPARTTEIATEIQQGGAFICHETTVHEDGEDGAIELLEGPNSKVCAGSLIVMEKMGRPNQDARFAERLGMYDPSRLDMNAPVVGSFVEWQQRHIPEEDREGHEHCSATGPDCEAPAGWSVGGGGIAVNTETWAENECPACGQPVCDACLAESGNCLDCDEE